MRRHFAVCLIALSSMGCGSNWNIRQGDEILVGCQTNRVFYMDIDGDGWGDPAIDGQVMCGPEGDITALNGRDCDDDNDLVTGRVGALCPAQLVASEDGLPVQHGGFIAGGSEFAWVYAEEEEAGSGGLQVSPLRSYLEAQDACEKWGGSLGVEGGHVGLATFDSTTNALDEVKDAITALSGTGPHAFFVGIEWDQIQSLWTWEDGSDDAEIEAIGWCRGEPVLPGDFFPNMHGEDAAISDVLDTLRLALVLNEDSRWCIGLPSDASSEDDVYTESHGHILCERPPPDPADYITGSQQDGDEADQ